MGGLTSLALRSLRARPGRTVTSIVGIALGVGVLFASIATDAGIDASIDRTVRDLVGRADLRVAAFQDRGLSPETVAAIADAPGVVVAAPVLERRTYLEPEPLAGGDTGLGSPVTILAIDPELDAEIRDLPLVAGEALAGPEAFAVLVTERLAAEDGLTLGGDVTLLAGLSGPVSLEVTGIIEGDGPFVGSAGRTVVAPLRTVQRLVDDDSVSRVDIVVGEGATSAEVEDALLVALTNEPYVLSSPRDLASSLRVSTADFRSTTALIAAVALFVGAFLIFNTLSMTVTERVRELGLLRAAGATRSQAGRFVLVQAIVLGVAGVLLGLAVGYVLSELMAAWVRSIGSIPFERVGITASSAILAVGIGLSVTLAAALEPARRAGAISPVEALKSRLEPVAARRARLRWLVGVFVAVGFAGLFFWPREGGTAGFVRALAVYALLLVVVLVLPYLLGGLSRVAGLPFAAVLRLEERLARAALARDRSRTALTVGALTIGLAMIVAIGGVAGQSRSAAGEWLADVIPGDELVTSIRPIDLVEEASTVDELAAIEGVERVSPIATFEVAHEGVRTDAAAVVGADLLDDGRLRLVAGDRLTALPALDAGGAVILPRAMSERLGLVLGQTLTLALGDGRVLDLRIVAIAERTIPGRAGEAILVGWRDATDALGVAGAEAFAIRYEPGTAAAARTELEATARSLALEPNPLERIAGAVDAALGRVFGLFDALAIVAVIVAALGIVNTLTMNVLERVREIGVLRAAGMTTSQVRRTVVVEAGILGVVGSILGIATGLVAGLIVVLLSGGRPLGGLTLPWGSIGLAALLGIGLSMLAAWYPARLASRLAIVRAVAHE
ncbi:MAG TPA: FtsX-like permease family protein [Candidatus Limnocylindrales bacterium]|nr:FtsX-like permease family protein [Candidatus Limnocylindrales bacterium]